MEPARKTLRANNINSSRSINKSNLQLKDIKSEIIQKNTIGGACLSNASRYKVVPILTKGWKGLDKIVPKPVDKFFDPLFDKEEVGTGFDKNNINYIQLKLLMLENMATSMDVGFGNIKTKEEIKNVLKKSDVLNILTIMDTKEAKIVAFIMLQNVENLEVVDFSKYLDNYKKGKGDLFINVHLKDKNLRGCCYKLIFDYMLATPFAEYNLFVNIILKPKKFTNPDVENGNSFSVYGDYLCFEKYGFRFMKKNPAYKSPYTKYYARLAYRPALGILSFNDFGATQSIRNFLGINEEIFYNVKNPFSEFQSTNGAFLLLSNEDSTVPLLQKGSLLCGWWQQINLSWRYGTKMITQDTEQYYNEIK